MQFDTLKPPISDPERPPSEFPSVAQHAFWPSGHESATLERIAQRAADEVELFFLSFFLEIRKEINRTRGS